jgi:hypothetical protein
VVNAFVLGRGVDLAATSPFCWCFDDSGQAGAALVWESCAIALGVLKELPDTGFRPADNYWISA